MNDSLAQAVWRRSRLFLLWQLLGWVFTTLAALVLSGPSFGGFAHLWGVIAAGPLSGVGNAFPLCGIPRRSGG